MKPTSRLFEPITLGGITFANRIAVSPMCQYSAEDGSANDWHLQHLGALSLSGAGLIVVEQTAVEPAGRISHGCLGLYSNANEAALARIVALCRRWGSARHPARACRAQGLGEDPVARRRAACRRGRRLDDGGAIGDPVRRPLAGPAGAR